MNDSVSKTNLAIRAIPLCWLMTFLLDPIQDLARLPVDCFDPKGLLSFLPNSWLPLLLTEQALFGLRVAGVLMSLVCVVKWRSRVAGIGLVSLSFLHQMIVRGFGHMNHAEIPLLLATVVLVLGVFTKERDVGILFGCLFVALLGYTLIAAFRLTHGSLPLLFSDGLAYYAQLSTLRDSQFDFRYGLVMGDWPLASLLLPFGFVVVTFLELTAPLSLVNLRYRLIFPTLMILFHAGVLLTMNILFWQNMVLIVLLYLLPRGSSSIEESS